MRPPPRANWPLPGKAVIGGLALAALATAACAPSHLHYRLQPAGGVVLLVPPSPSLQPQLTLVNLRRRPACARFAGKFADSRFGFRWRLAQSQLRLEVDPGVQRFSGNLPVPLLDGIAGLRNVLARAVAADCLPEVARARLLRRVVESMSIAPDLAQDIVLGPYATQRYADLGDGMGLTLSYALDPRQPGRYDLGYVSRRYLFIRTTPDGRGRLHLEAVAVRAAPASTTTAPSPLAIPGAEPPEFFRLLFYLRRSDADHDVALLAASSQAALELATHALLTVPGICAQLKIAGAECLLAPPDMGMDAEVTVEVQGRRVAVPLPATVEQALLAAGAPPGDTILPALQVTRPYHGRLIPVQAPTNRRLLLNLVLSGGERIRW